MAQVIESNTTEFPKGTIVHGRLAWQKYSAMSTKDLEKVNPDLTPISTAVSLLGIPGLAAYFGMLSIGNPKKGETVVVSGAAGGVGSIAAQIAKLQGCQVIGIAGSDKKIDYLENNLGINKGINYKKPLICKKQLAEWLNSDELKYKENLIKGFENIPSAFIGLFEGENIGKQMIKVAEPD